MTRKKWDFLEVHLGGKLCVKFHNVAMKNTTCAITLLAKFELSARVLSHKSDMLNYGNMMYLLHST